jgi:hypothetical protein
LLAPRPTPIPEDQASVFISPRGRVATHFSRLLRHACVTVGLFLFLGHHTGRAATVNLYKTLNSSHFARFRVVTTINKLCYSKHFTVMTSCDLNVNPNQNFEPTSDSIPSHPPHPPSPHAANLDELLDATRTAVPLNHSGKDGLKLFRRSYI